MMAAKNETGQETPVSFGPTDYFIKSILPLTVKGARKVVTKATPRIQNENELVLLVRSGTGRMIINNEDFELKRGVFMCLGPFHNYALKPDPGSSLELLEGATSCSAYMYILSCPYLKVKEMTVPAPPAVTLLTEEETVDAEQTLQLLCGSTDSDYFCDKLKFLYMMKLIGILISKIYMKPPAGDRPVREKKR